MKKSTRTAKLSLNHETVKLLKAHTLTQVAGGIDVTKVVACPIGTAQTDCG